MHDMHAWLQVHATRGRFKACGQVAVADCGAEVHMADVKARSMCIGGVQAAGFGTTLNLQRCDISDAASATSDAVRNWVVRAVWLQVCYSVGLHAFCHRFFAPDLRCSAVHAVCWTSVLRLERVVQRCPALSS
jgi:hypothetical protein